MKVVVYKGEIVYDTSKPGGTMRNLLDIPRFERLSWKNKSELDDGIKKSYNDFLNSEIRTER